MDGRRRAPSRPASTRSSSSARGPGGLQVSLRAPPPRRPARGHLRRRRPGRDVPRWPFFQRLLSWTKPYAPAERGAREYQRYDWNSLLADEPELRSLQAEFLDGTVVLPVAPRDAAEPRGVRRAGRRSAVRYGTPLGVDAARGRARRHHVRRRDDRRRVPLPACLVLAVGVARAVDARRRPASSSRATTRTRATRRRTPASGCSSSASRTAASSSRRAWRRGRRRSPCARRRPPRRASRPSRWSASGRATSSRSRTASWASGCGSSMPRSTGSRTWATRIRVDLRRTDTGEAMSVEADEVIAATGFTCPLQDLPGPRRRDLRGEPKLPAVTPFWESASVPGIYFAGTISQAAPGLAQARHPGLLGRGARAPLQQPHPRPPPRRDALRRRRRSGRSSRAERPRAVPAARGDARPGAVAPEGVPGARRLGRAGRRPARRGDPARSCTRSTAWTGDMVAMTVEADGTGGALPGRLRPPRRPRSRSTPCRPTRCWTSRRRRTGRARRRGPDLVGAA